MFAAPARVPARLSRVCPVFLFSLDCAHYSMEG
nr:MAG TPA: hypothetical protein [Caudoviricetes sp.]